MVGAIDAVIDNSSQIDVDSFTDDTITVTMVATGTGINMGETVTVPP